MSWPGQPRCWSMDGCEHPEFRRAEAFGDDVARQIAIQRDEQGGDAEWEDGPGEAEPAARRSGAAAGGAPPRGHRPVVQDQHQRPREREGSAPHTTSPVSQTPAAMPSSPSAPREAIEAAIRSNRSWRCAMP
jgi:hypothetical protein